MNDIKKDTTMNRSAVDDGEMVYAHCESIWCESAGDFTLPDYMPEIGKMLTCTPRLIPSGKYIGSDRAEFSGSVVYSVLYTGDDGLPFYTTLSGEYEYTVPLGDAADSGRVEIYDEPFVESVSVRASGPRKISVRARIRSRPCIAYENKIIEDDIPDPSEYGYQRLTEVRNVSAHRHFESGEFTISEQFKLDSSPDAEPVGCDGVIYITDMVKSAASLLCRGEVECRVLYYDIEGGRRRLLSSKKKIRFEHDIPISETGSTIGVRAYGRVISMDMAVSEDSNEMSVTAVADIVGEYTTESEKILLRDIYSCGAACSVKYENTEYSKNVLCRNLNVSCHAEKTLAESEREYCVCTSSAVPKVGEVSVSDGNAEFTGDITVDCLLASADGEGVEYSSVSVNVPFKCDAPVAAMTEKYDISVVGETAGVRTRIEKDKLCVDAELYLSVLIEGTDSVSTVKSASAVSLTPIAVNKGVSVYYPDKGETLWSVAKKYSVPVSAVAEINGLSSDSPDSSESLGSVRCLLIV